LSEEQVGTDVAPETDSVSSAISRGVVRIYAELYGRGPTRARTYVDDDYVFTVLDGSFTVADRTLMRAGKARQVEETRRAFQEAVREQFIEVVESETGREVDVFMSQIDPGSEVAVELFLLKDGDPAP
jgi:uncharacterized protein YbcI